MSLRDKRVFEISEVEITGVDCVIAFSFSFIRCNIMVDT